MIFGLSASQFQIIKSTAFAVKRYAPGEAAFSHKAAPGEGIERGGWDSEEIDWIETIKRQSGTCTSTNVVCTFVDNKTCHASHKNSAPGRVIFFCGNNPSIEGVECRVLGDD